MSPNDRDENEGSAEAKPTDTTDATKPDAAEPAGETDLPAGPADETTADVEQPAPTGRKLGRTWASGLWAGLIAAAIVLIFLLVFILQNLDEVEVHFLMFTGTVPIGVALLLSAIAGILMVAVPGVARMIQWRRFTKR